MRLDAQHLSDYLRHCQILTTQLTTCPRLFSRQMLHLTFMLPSLCSGPGFAGLAMCCRRCVSSSVMAQIR